MDLKVQQVKSTVIYGDHQIQILVEKQSDSPFICVVSLVELDMHSVLTATIKEITVKMLPDTTPDGQAKWAFEQLKESMASYVPTPVPVVPAVPKTDDQQLEELIDKFVIIKNADGTLDFGYAPPPAVETVDTV